MEGPDEKRFEGFPTPVNKGGINSRGENGRTPIMTAAVEGNSDIFSDLYAQKANITLTDDKGDTLLHLAARGGNTTIVECLLKHQPIECLGRDELTPLMAAAYEGQWEAFSLLIEKGAETNTVTKAKISLLHCAIIGGNEKIKRLSLSLPQFSNNSGKRQLWVTLMIAARRGDEDLYFSLASRKSFPPVGEKHWNILLIAASEGGSVKIVDHILPNSDTEYVYNVKKLKRTPLMVAAARGHHDVFQLLLENNAELDEDAKDKHHDTILHLACQGGSLDIVKHVFEMSKLNRKGRNDWTPIMKAAFQGFASVFNFLVRKGADMKTLAKNGDTLLHLACMGGNQEIANKLLSFFGINTKGEHGWTPVMKMAASDKPAMYEFLLSKGADISLIDKNGDSLFHLACHGRSTEIIKHLLADADLSKKGKYGRTPLMTTIATVNQHHEIITILLAALTKRAGYDSNDDIFRQKITDDEGDTLLHHACRGGNKDLVETLLQHEDVNLQGRYGWTPAMVAVYFGHEGLIKFLLDRGADLTLLAENDEDILSIASRGKNPKLRKYLMSKEAVRPVLLEKKKAKRK